jgi:Predicted Zn-dependent peptidases, insulinase-like
MTHPAFEFIRKERIPSLNLTVEEHRHRATEARYFHFDTKDSNNAFLVAFRTVPMDSTGVAHILEHTTLCGSERFPVRDPFFMMIRRSLNTFMNAFTANDWTAYPFASQNRKDFDNLLKVYLDAVFFPRLDPLDFAQEGHRVEFTDADNPDPDLVYKGVVYNEMKGAMGAPVRRLWQTLQSHLFPTTTYHYNSGGEPEDIPKLTYKQLTAFHARHYHPSNAVFMTYGNFPVAEHQAMIQTLALKRFKRESLDLTIPDERRYPAPFTVQASYPLDGDEDPKHKTHIALGWLLGHCADLREMMDAELLSGVLLDNSASPLRQVLETTDLGSAPSELCGLDDSTREAIFTCGLEGSDPEHAEAVERLILNVLHDVAQNGVPEEQVESVLHQLELSQREIGGGSFPYGLQLIVRALPVLLHGGDPVAFLNLDPVLSELRAEIKSPNFVPSLVRRLLLDNPHRVCLTMAPDREQAERILKAEARHLAAMKKAMNENDKIRVVAQAQALKARQEREDDPEILPRVGLKDIPQTLKIPDGVQERVEGVTATWYAQGTNGLVYEQIVVDLPQLAPALVDDLPLFCECVTEVGCGARDYIQNQALQAAVSGGISARMSVRATLPEVQRARGVFVLAGKALARNQQPLTELLWETVHKARFDELPRLRELISQLCAQRESAVTDHGHTLAMSAASSGMGPCGMLAHRWGGLLGLRALKALDEALKEEARLRAFAAQLEHIRDAIASVPRQALVVSEEPQQPEIRTALKSQFHKLSPINAGSAHFAPQGASFSVRQGWSINTQVNFCAKAYPGGIAQDHPDAPALTVLGPFLRNGFLHRAIREQGGAYGAGASYDPDTGSFRFFSYRDPRLTETLADFDAALAWLQSARHEPRQLEEAILGVIGAIDRPDSPAGEAINAFFHSLHGRVPAWRRQFRQAVLKVSLDDLRRVARQYLKPEAASIAVISSQKTLEQHCSLDLELCRL